MKVVLTSDWPPDKFAPYGPFVTAAMKKLRDRFPREVTVDHLAKDISTGKRQLWLILDDDDRFISFVLTQIDINDATGRRSLVLPSFAGEEGASTVPLIRDIEAWGKSQGCDETVLFGRLGWKRAVAREGYDLDVAIYRKALA